MSVATAFLQSAIKRFREYKALGDNTLAQLTDTDLLFMPNEWSNSIAIIIQHLQGNMVSRWTNFLTEDGEKSWRRRDEEFEALPLPKAEILERWNEGWKVFLQALEALHEEDLLKTITIRSQPLLVIDAINRQMAHYSYHIGQIAYLGRWRKEAAWQSLSIPKGQSLDFKKKMEDEQKEQAM
jgi:hypothetical protein